MISEEDIAFNQENHIYHYRDKKLDSVTQILKSEGFVDDRWYTEESSDRGGFVHEAAAAIDYGDLSPEDFTGELAGYIQAWQTFKRDTDFIPYIIERRVVNPDLEYAGTIDRIGKWKNGSSILIDIKTGNKTFPHGLQLAAYYEAGRKTIQSFPKNIVRRLVILKKNGDWKIERQDPKLGEYDSQIWNDIWKAVCTARVYKKRYGIKGGK